MIRRELQIFGASVLYFSRLPLPVKIPYSKDNQQLILTWFPVVGILLGGIGALGYFCASIIFPENLAIVIAIATMILVTGAFHEDGFADVCDAFGGGYTKEQRLTIMKDSRVGAYAVIGLILLFVFKFYALSTIGSSSMIFVLIASQALSRWPLLLITKIWPYARTSIDSKSVDSSKPLSYIRIFVASITAILPMFLFSSRLIFLAIPLLTTTSLISGLWFNKKIEGYTGDCLGATQQINEVVFYLFCVGIQYQGIHLI